MRIALLFVLTLSGCAMRVPHLSVAHAHDSSPSVKASADGESDDDADADSDDDDDSDVDSDSAPSATKADLQRAIKDTLTKLYQIRASQHD